MKKNIIIILILLLITGCSVTKIDDSSLNSLITTTLYSDSKIYNVNYDGFKFYLPRNNVVTSKSEKNLVIESNEDNYYLYVDYISYYYKTKEEHTNDNSIFYSETLENDDKFGYIDITLVDDKYFIEYMYNYAKIEAYVESSNLTDAILDMSSILRSIKFNDAAIKYNLNNEEFKTTSEEYDIFKSKKDSDDFLQWIEKYDKYEKEDDKVEDQDVIDTDED